MRCAWLVPALFVLGCKSDSAQLATALDEASSALATAAAVGDANAGNRVPTQYAVRTIDESLRTIDGVTVYLGSSSGAAALRTRGRQWTGAARAPLRGLRAMLEAQAHGIESTTRWLDAAADSLHALGEAARSQR